MRIRLFVFGVVLGAAVFGNGCRSPGPGQPSVVNCTTQAVQQNWARVFPAVQTCLSAIMASPLTCLDALPSTLEVAIDSIACVVEASGREAASQQEANPSDVVSARRFERAKAWLETRQIEFR